MSIVWYGCYKNIFIYVRNQLYSYVCLFIFKNSDRLGYWLNRIVDEVQDNRNRIVDEVQDNRNRIVDEVQDNRNN